MRCERLGADLSAHADGELAPRDAARVQEHLERCEDCRATLERWRAIGDRLRDEAHALDRASFPGELRRALPIAAAGSRPARGRWVRRSAIAATVLLAVPVLLHRAAGADPEIRELAALGGTTHAAADDAMTEIDAIEWETLALALRARARASDPEEAAALRAEAKAIVAETRRLRAHIWKLQRELEREGVPSRVEEESR